jgi:hypothetical protein
MLVVAPNQQHQSAASRGARDLSVVTASVVDLHAEVHAATDAGIVVKDMPVVLEDAVIVGETATIVHLDSAHHDLASA